MCSPTNLGFAGGANLGIEYCLFRSKYIMLLDNDTEVSGDFLNELIKVLDSNNNIDVASSVVHNYFDRDKIPYVGRKLQLWQEVILPLLWIMPKDSFEDYTQIVKTEHISFWAVLIKSEVFQKIGLFDNKLFWSWEDIDFCIRAKRANISMVRVPFSIVYHKSNSSKIGKVLQYYSTRNKFIIMKKYTSNFEYIIFVIYMVLVHFWLVALYNTIIWRLENIGGFVLGVRDGLCQKN